MLKKQIKNFQIISIIFVLLLGLFSIIGSGGDDSGCERVTGLAEGYGDIKIRNNLGGSVNVMFFDWVPLGASIRPHKCEIFGLPSETGTLEITRCEWDDNDDDCIDYGSTEYVTVTVVEGGTEEIIISDYF